MRGLFRRVPITIGAVCALMAMLIFAYVSTGCSGPKAKQDGQATQPTLIWEMGTSGPTQLYSIYRLDTKEGIFYVAIVKEKSMSIIKVLTK